MAKTLKMTILLASLASILTATVAIASVEPWGSSHLWGTNIHFTSARPGEMEQVSRVVVAAYTSTSIIQIQTAL